MHPLNEINLTDFNNDITAAFSNFEHFDFNLLLSHFNSTSSSLLDKHAPEKTIHITTRYINLWFTPNFLHERQKRRQLECAWCKSHSNNDRLLYCNQCRLYNSLLKKAQSNYFSSLFVNCPDSKSLALH